MNIAFFSYYWSAISERWIQRMLGYLQDSIKIFAASDAQPRWNSTISGFTLSPPFYSEKPLTRILLHRLNNKYQKKIREFQLRRLMYQEKIDTLIINYLTVAIDTQYVWRDFPCNVFLHCHGFDVHFDAIMEFPPFNQLHSPHYINKVLSLPDHVTFIANSLHTREKLKAIGIADRRIKVKYFGVETHEWINRQNSEEVTILFLGRLTDCKGPDLLIRAFEHACQNGLNGKLLIAGDGPQLTTCELIRRRSPFADKISMLGAVTAEQADKLYQKADIFSCHHTLGPITKREEAFGVVLLEAMSYGLPVLTGASGGVSESIVDGCTGFLFSPGDIETHAELLLKLSLDRELRESLGRNGWKRIHDNFTLDHENKQFMNILSGQ